MMLKARCRLLVAGGSLLLLLPAMDLAGQGCGPGATPVRLVKIASA